jgi:hypothetical protein
MAPTNTGNGQWTGKKEMGICNAETGTADNWFKQPNQIYNIINATLQFAYKF